MSKVKVIRPKKMLQGGISLYIYCDGENVGKIKNGESCEFEIEEGNHNFEIGHRNSDNSYISVDHKELKIEKDKDLIINIEVSFTGFSIKSVE